ncbi:MAG: hypothetical protein JNN07_21245, partial [Verrucomicrobiales bacterium]|nr:hypothetical protein [Verrucomicrobiales bacterium]
MKPTYRLYRRGASGRYYAQDRTTNKQESLGTSDKAEAVRLLNAKNESAYHPGFNIHLARTYLSAADPTVATRTWQVVMDALVSSKAGNDPSTAARYERGLKQAALDTFRDLPVLQTQPEHILT